MKKFMLYAICLLSLFSILSLQGNNYSSPKDYITGRFINATDMEAAKMVVQGKLPNSWDYFTHSLNGGVTYSGIQHYGVGAIQLGYTENLSISSVQTNLTCNGNSTGKIDITVSGGTTPYTYNWNVLANQGQGTAHVFALAAGNYTVTVTDHNLLTNVQSWLITQPTGLSGSGMVTNVSCFGGNNGTASSQGFGGTAPYTYKWSNNSTAQLITGLTAGRYYVTITDVNNCTTMTWQDIIQPSNLTIAGTTVNVTCQGSNNGKIDITVNGGSAPYTYNWNVLANQGQGTAHVFALAAGTYKVTVTDNNLCTKVQSWLITQPSFLAGSGMVTNVSCYGGNNGTASIQGFGGTAPYTYKWSNNSTAQLITGLTAGQYYVTITDVNNCFTMTWQDISQPRTAIAIAGNATNVTCQGSSNGKIDVTVIGGWGGYTGYIWSNGQTGSTATNLTSGNYTVTVTDAGGCTSVSQPFYVGTTSFLPGPAGPITGSNVINQGQTGIVYSVAPISNATGYAWTLPAGAIITNGSNTASITVDFSASSNSGLIYVNGTNNCGSGISSETMFITITPLNLILQNITPGIGNYCYNAIQTITVAGSNSTFTVNAGAIVTMIAGQNIIFLPGTTVMQSGYLYGYITTNGQYCTQPVNPVVNNPSQGKDVQVFTPEIVKSQLVRVYPNPTTGAFTLELNGTEGSGLTKVEIYEMNGMKIMSEDLRGERKHSFTIERQRSGLYFIHLTTGTTKGTVKLIKL